MAESAPDARCASPSVFWARGRCRVNRPEYGPVSLLHSCVQPLHGFGEIFFELEDDVAGAQLVQQHGMAPLANNMGLFVATPSYNGRIAFSIISERAIMPDIAFFRECIEESFADLMAGVPKAEKTKAATATPKPAAKTAPKPKAKPKAVPKPATKPRAKPVAKGNATRKTPKK